MTPELTVTLFSDAVWLIILMVAVLVVPGLIVGLGIAVFQAATQINEQTLSFLPRLIVTLLMVIFAGHWILRKIME
ncbi:flagellar biosynthetic protein FliQ, partial [Vibrio parahaemolyticus]|nr:flagellar biosynthetic protein FliQ [Vibrio parahaemolyticus]